MKHKSVAINFLMGILLLSPLSVVLADDVPSQGSKPLSLILKSVEGQNLGSISEAKFDDGLWEVKVCADTACQKLYINPKSGEEMRRKKTDSEELPPANSVALSNIVQSIEAHEQGTITKVEFDDGIWEVKLRNDGRKIKLAVDPRTGETKH